MADDGRHALAVRPWQARSEAEQLAADRAVGFFTQFLTISKGQGRSWRRGDPFIPLPWQEHQVIRPLFGTLRPDGLRQYRTLWLEVGKKSGKSEKAAGIGLKCLFADDEPSAEVYIGASDKDQAKIIFDAAVAMVKASPALRRRCRIYEASKRILVVEGAQEGSFLEALAADADSADGKSPSCLIFDEIHRYRNREFFDTLVRSTASRLQPLIVELTTAGVDTDSLGWTEHEYARQVLEGVIDDPSLLAVIWAAPRGGNILDWRYWQAANPSIGHTVPWEYYETEARKAIEDPTSENSFRRFHGNEWVSQVERWMPMDIWDASAGDADLEHLAAALSARPCWGGLDLSQTRDLTALVLVGAPAQAEGAFPVLCRAWIPEENVQAASRRDGVRYDAWVEAGWLKTTPGNTIDYDTIERDVRADAMRFPIHQVAFDPTYAWQLAQHLANAGLSMWPLRQGFETMAGPMADLLQLSKERRIWHGGNPVLRWAMDNMVAEQDSIGRWRPSKRKAKKRIDPGVAAIMALDRAERNLYGDGEEEQDSSVWIYDDPVIISPHI